MQAEIIKEVIADQQLISNPPTYVSRAMTEHLIELAKTEPVIVISGLRRCGKSTLMTRIRLDKQADYFINFDDDRLALFKVEDFQRLFEIFIELFGQQDTFYLDEIQNIDGWERFIRRLHQQGYRVVITGSNATMFSRELGTRLTGRYIRIDMYPYSFHELLCFAEANVSGKKIFNSIDKGIIKRLFGKYIEYGGIPEYYHRRNKEYLHELYQSILYRDILARNNIANERILKELVHYLASNISKELSFNLLRKLLGLGSTTTVSDYCAYLEDSYLCYFVRRYDYSLKRQMQLPKKVYFVDHALAVKIGFRFSEDRGRLFENIVFMELKRRYQDIYYHQATKECDFIIREQLIITEAIQVCVSLSDEASKRREYAGLIEAMVNYKLSGGLILTEDEEALDVIEHDGLSYRVQDLAHLEMADNY